jgi:glycosyltransferase involved in cell wall biosynthesis
VIAPQPFFTPRGTPLSVYYRTVVMAELGLEVDLLTYGLGDDVDIPGVTIHRAPSLGFRRVGVGPSWRKLLLDIVLFVKLVHMLATTRYTFVHAHEEAVFMCVPLKRWFGFRLVYDMHSSLPQQLTNFGFTRSRILIGAFEWLEKAALRSADFVITICEDLAEYAVGFLDTPERHELIENSIFDPVHMRPAGDLVDGLGADPADAIPPERRLVVYAGTLEPYQGIDVLIRAFADVARRVDDAYLLIAGGTPEQVAHYAGMANGLGLDGRCLFTGVVPRRRATAYNGRASVLVSPRSVGGNTPLKIYEQLASGRPIVATAIHSHTQVLDHDVAFLVGPNPRDLADGIVCALEDGEASAARVRAAQRLYESRYSRERYTEKLGRMLRTLD